MLSAKDRQWKSCFAGTASAHPSTHLGMVLQISTLAVLASEFVSQHVQHSFRCGQVNLLIGERRGKAQGVWLDLHPETTQGCWQLSIWECQENLCYCWTKFCSLHA